VGAQAAQERLHLFGGGEAARVRQGVAGHPDGDAAEVSSGRAGDGEPTIDAAAEHLLGGGGHGDGGLAQRQHDHPPAAERHGLATDDEAGGGEAERAVDEKGRFGGAEAGVEDGGGRAAQAGAGAGDWT